MNYSNTRSFAKMPSANNYSSRQNYSQNGSWGDPMSSSDLQNSQLMDNNSFVDNRVNDDMILAQMNQATPYYLCQNPSQPEIDTPISPWPPSNITPPDMIDYPPMSIPQMPFPTFPEMPNDNLSTPAFLREHIGQLMRVEFLIGDRTSDRIGYLREVGASYIVLEAIDAESLIMCDLFAIKFATILREDQLRLRPTPYQMQDSQSQFFK